MRQLMKEREPLMKSPVNLMVAVLLAYAGVWNGCAALWSDAILGGIVGARLKLLTYLDEFHAKTGSR